MTRANLNPVLILAVLQSTALSPLAAQNASVAIHRFLSARGFTLEQVHTSEASYYAAEVLRLADSTRHVVALGYYSDSVVSLREPIELLEIPPWERVDVAEWVGLVDTTVDFLRVTFDNPMDNFVGTHLYRISGGRLVDSFHDATDACTPAEVRDVDGDGQVELITWIEDPTPGNCGGDELEINIRFAYGVSVAWARVYAWSSGQWIVAEANYPEFYADLATRYEAVLKVLPSEHESLAWSYLGWTDGRLISSWAERARERARGR